MARPLDSITDKADNLYAGLREGLDAKLDARLSGASAQELNEIKSALHFSWLQHGGTTSQSREDIRKALTTYLAEGGSVAGARALRETMTGLDPAAQSELSKKIGADPGPDFGNHMTRQLAPVMDVGDPAQLQTVNHIIGGVPGDVERASRHERCFREDALALNRDAEGRLKLETPAQMSQNIRQAYVAAGGPEQQAAALDQFLAGKDTAEIADMANILSKPDAEIATCVATGLFCTADTAAQDFATLEPVLLALPADPTRAGQPICATDSVSLERNDQGALTISNVSAAHVSIPIPEKNRGLSAEKIEQLKNQFYPVIGQNYGRHGVVLDFAEKFRQEKLINPQATMAEMLQTYRPDGASVADKNHGGDCYGQAEIIKREFAKPEVDVESFTVGKYCAANTEQRIGDRKKQLADSQLKSGRVTHMDVIVPYTNDKNEERILVLTPGEGKTDKCFQDLSMAQFRSGGELNVQMRVARGDDPSAISLDPAKLQKNAMGYRANLMLMNGSPGTPGAKHMAGIDLAAGTVYLTTASSAAYQGPKLADQKGSASFNYRDAMQNPNDIVTLKYPTDDGGFKTRDMTKEQALREFVDAVGEQFGQSNEFTSSVLTLAANEEEYHQNVLWPSVQEAHGLNQGNALAQNLDVQAHVSVRDQLHEKSPGSEQKLREVPTAARLEFEALQKKLSEIKKTAGNAALEKNFAVSAKDKEISGQILDKTAAEFQEIKEKMAKLKEKNPGLKQLERGTVGRNVHSAVRDIKEGVRAHLGH